MNKTESEIKKLKEKVKSFRDQTEIAEEKEIRLLKDIILEIHAHIEGMMEYLLWGSFCDIPGHTLSPKQVVNHLRKAARTFEKIDFSRKVVLCTEIAELPDSLRKNIMKVNDLRIAAAHPVSYSLKKYSDRNRYLGVLKQLTYTMEITDKFLSGRADPLKQFVGPKDKS